MNSDEKSKIHTLYSSGKSMWEVSQILNCSTHKVSYWLNKLNVKKRTRSDAMYLKLNPLGDPFMIKLSLSASELYLMGIGLGIYWGEGNKSDRFSVKITNTDPKMILTFRKFLREICNVKESKLGYSIISFKDSDTTVVGEYWSQNLGIPIEKFGKIVQVPPQGKGTYTKKSEFGVCSICFSNIKLKRWIMQNLSSPVSSTAERALGKG